MWATFKWTCARLALRINLLIELILENYYLNREY
jgi:hypothetical protein